MWVEWKGFYVLLDAEADRTFSHSPLSMSICFVHVGIDIVS